MSLLLRRVFRSLGGGAAIPANALMIGGEYIMIGGEYITIGG